MQRVVKFSVLFLVALALIACATFTRDAYRTLAVSYQTYDTTLSVVGDLYKEGKVTEAQKTKVIALGRTYAAAHNGTVIALANYETVNTDISKQAYVSAAINAAKALAEFVAYCQPLIEKGGK